MTEDEISEFVAYLSIRISREAEKSDKHLTSVIGIMSTVIGARISISCDSQQAINQALDVVQMDIIRAAQLANKQKV